MTSAQKKLRIKCWQSGLLAITGTSVFKVIDNDPDALSGKSWRYWLVTLFVVSVYVAVQVLITWGAGLQRPDPETTTNGNGKAPEPPPLTPPPAEPKVGP